MKLSVAIMPCVGCLLLSTAWSSQPRAADDPARVRLNHVIAVLRLKPSAAGRSCLDTMLELHKTEDQVKSLSSRAQDPDKELAEDVLESDYENGGRLCGADAERVCASQEPSAPLRAACKTLDRSGAQGD